ncbi:MFS transporter [Alphaproteobacteria bacterium]|nr:MFS transporter [Alphaproteobacteria bacterium]
MFLRRIPRQVRPTPAPTVKGFAVLTGIEAMARGMLVSVFPIAMYKALGDAETVSEVYFMIGLFSLTSTLLTPWVARSVPRRYLFSTAILLNIAGVASVMSSDPLFVPIGLALNMVGVAILSIALNAYVLDYVERHNLSACETQRLFYSGAAWTIGPYFGIWLFDLWSPAPFLLSIAASVVLLAVFWVMRLGDGKAIRKATSKPTNPLAFLPRFLEQPRLIAGWLFAVLRSCGWWFYIVYLPIYAVEAGLSEQIGGITLSITNGLLFTAPFILKWIQSKSIRFAVRFGFTASATFFVAAMLLNAMPWVTIALLMLASFFLIVLDVCGGLPFLMAVKPSERTEMSAIYATYRDVSGILTPGAARLVLFAGPLPAVFGIAAMGLMTAALIAGRLHPRLGQRKLEG